MIGVTGGWRRIGIGRRPRDRPRGARRGAPMSCPTCHGTKEVGPAFVDAVDDQGFRYGDVRMIGCYTCHGTGEVDDEYPERRKAGKEWQEWRKAHDLSQRELGAKVDISAPVLSRFEFGTEVLTEEQFVRLWRYRLQVDRAAEPDFDDAMEIMEHAIDRLAGDR